MQRDMHTLRATLLAVEAGELDDLDPAYIQMAVEIGMLAGMEMGGGSRKHYIAAALQLTPQGHDFVALARSDAIWSTVAKRVEERVGSTSFGIWLGLLEAEHKKVLSDDGA